MNIAFVTTRLFGRPGNGGEMCSARLINGLLEAGHRLHVIGRGVAPVHAADGIGFTHARIRYHAVAPGVASFDSLPRGQQGASLVAAWVTGQASTVQRLNHGGVPRQVVKLLDDLHAGGDGPIDALVVDHLQAWAWVAQAQSRLPRPLLMMHNLEADGYDERARHAAAAGQAMRAAVFAREARLLQALETEALRHAAAVACLSESDAAALRAHSAAAGTQPTVQVLPGFPSAAGHADTAPPAHTEGAERRRIGMLGTWTWGPNRDGLDWMLTQVLPQLPLSCELVLAGQGLSNIAPSPRVRVLGRVDDVQDFYDALDVVAVPSWTGSGVHEKAIEALARARVVVATPHALRGLGDGLPSHVHIARGAADFAKLCAHAGPGPDAAAATRRWAAQRRRRYDAALQRCLDAMTPRSAASVPPTAVARVPVATPSADRCSD